MTRVLACRMSRDPLWLSFSSWPDAQLLRHYVYLARLRRAEVEIATAAEEARKSGIRCADFGEFGSWSTTSQFGVVLNLIQQEDVREPCAAVLGLGVQHRVQSSCPDIAYNCAPFSLIYKVPLSASFGFLVAYFR
jgi:hypothetical protein